MPEIKTAALLGLGAIGILYGRPLAAHSALTVIADAQRQARYRAQPGRCNGEEYRFDYTAPGDGQPVDLVLVACKATQLAAAIEDMRAFVGPDTVILSLLNGITSEEKIEGAYPGHTLWGFVIGTDATRDGRNLVYKNDGKILFGEKNGDITPRVQAVAAYFARCGVPGEACADVRLRQWHKLMVNVGINQAAAVYGLTYEGLARPGEVQDRMLAAMQETIALARAEGYPLPEDSHLIWLRDAAPTLQPDGMPSMLQDVLAGRPTEVEEFSGEVRRRSRRYGLPTPANDFFYEAIRQREAGYLKGDDA